MQLKNSKISNIKCTHHYKYHISASQSARCNDHMHY